MLGKGDRNSSLGVTLPKGFWDLRKLLPHSHCPSGRNEVRRKEGCYVFYTNSQFGHR